MYSDMIVSELKSYSLHQLEFITVTYFHWTILITPLKHYRYLCRAFSMNYNFRIGLRCTIQVLIAVKQLESHQFIPIVVSSFKSEWSAQLIYTTGNGVHCTKSALLFIFFFTLKDLEDQRLHVWAIRVMEKIISITLVTENPGSVLKTDSHSWSAWGGETFWH